MKLLAPNLRCAAWAAPVLGASLAVAILRAAPGDLMPVALIACALSVLVAWIIWQDLATFTISDAALLAVGALAFAARWSSASAEGEKPWHALAAMAEHARGFGWHTDRPQSVAPPLLDQYPPDRRMQVHVLVGVGVV